MNVHDDLLSLFAAHSVTALEANNGQLLKTAFNKASVEELVCIPGYTGSYSLIRECKVQLEDIFVRCGQAHEQIIACLEFISLSRKNDLQQEMTAFCELVKRGPYRSAWTADQQQVFDRKYNVIVNWRHYFLSYTNRNATPTNNSFAKIIKFAFDQRIRRENANKANLVARVVAQILNQNNVHGFFDVNEIRSGDDIGDKVRDYCKSCCAFIQIVEHATFTAPPAGKINWCFEEYEEFRKDSELEKLSGCTHDKRYHFVITVDQLENLKPAVLPAAYTGWFDHIGRLRFKTVCDGKYNDLRADVSEVAKEIVALWDLVIQGVLRGAPPAGQIAARKNG